MGSPVLAAGPRGECGRGPGSLLGSPHTFRTLGGSCPSLSDRSPPFPGQAGWCGELLRSPAWSRRELGGQHRRAQPRLRKARYESLLRGSPPSHLPRGQSGARARCPSAAAAGAGGTRLNSSSFISVFPSKAGRKQPHGRPAPGWLQGRSSSARPREKGGLRTVVLNRHPVVDTGVKRQLPVGRRPWNPYPDPSPRWDPWDRSTPLDRRTDRQRAETYRNLLCGFLSIFTEQNAKLSF